jgi:hypothetical protein
MPVFRSCALLPLVLAACGTHDAGCQEVGLSPSFAWAMAGYADCLERCPAGAVPTFTPSLYACACGLAGSEDLTACDSDADCFVGEAGACACEAGGPSVAVGIRGAPRWSAQLSSARARCAERVLCEEFVACAWNFPLACVKGRCTLRER